MTQKAGLKKTDLMEILRRERVVTEKNSEKQSCGVVPIKFQALTLYQFVIWSQAGRPTVACCGFSFSGNDRVRTVKLSQNTTVILCVFVTLNVHFHITL